MTKIAEEFTDKVYVGIHHSTLNTRFRGRRNDYCYHVSQQEFNDMCQRGEFLSTAEYLGNSYGFSRKEFAKAVKMNCICITNMWLPEALTLHASGIHSCLILTITDDESLHSVRLAEDYEDRRLSVFIPGGVKVLPMMVKGNEKAVEVKNSNIEMKQGYEVKNSKDVELQEINEIEEENLSEEKLGIVDEICKRTCEIGKQNIPSSYELRKEASRVSEQTLDSQMETIIEQILNEETEKLREHNLHNQNVRTGKKIVGYNLEIGNIQSNDQNMISENTFIGQDLKHIENSKICSVDSKSEFSAGNADSERKLNSGSMDLYKKSEEKLENNNEKISKNLEGINYKVNKPIVGTMEVKKKQNNINKCCESEQSIDVLSGIVEENESTISNTDIEKAPSAPTFYPMNNTILKSEPYLSHEDKETELYEDLSFISKTSQSERTISTPESSSQFFPDFLTTMGEKRKEKIVRMGLQYRNAYFRIHQQNPGFFEFVIYTDNLDGAACHLKNFLKHYIYHPKKFPIFSPERDPSYNEIVLAKINKFTEDLNRFKSVMAQQHYEILKPLNKKM
ncbi:hypothetical protein L9F63_003601 [Diploptera punctata]|uniref:Guanylate kinase-like domain-containing protein n=1 Tax=Diploptera punctata TaxID=6984 RepID=A0AAD7ZK37_DIPPU|nr:hypothetical protein L9F63_003601 [Diploptera punctata]